MKVIDIISWINEYENDIMLVRTTSVLSMSISRTQTETAARRRKLRQADGKMMR
jgi:hypothetical protein